MNGSSPGLWLRLGAALLLAIAGIAILQVLVEASASAGAGRLAGPVEDRPTALQALGFRLQPVAGPVLVTQRLALLPADVRPVVEVLGDGSVALRRPPPLARHPMAAAAAAGRAGIVVPAGALATLGPAVRGTLVELVAALATERPVPASFVQPVEPLAVDPSLATLLRWVP